jgi:outer membrane protein TolC
MHLRSYLATIALTIFLLVIARTTLAVGPEPQRGRETIELSLPQAVALALKNNLNLQTSRRNVNRAASNYRTAKAGYSPNIDIAVTGNQGFQSILVNDRLEYTQAFTAGFNITATMPLDLSGAIGRAVQQALINFITIKTNYAIAGQDLIVQTYREYYDVLRGQASIKIDQGQVDQTLEQLRIARERLKAGRVPEVDVITAQVQYDNARQNLKISEGNLELAKSRLRNTLLLPQKVDLIPTDRLTFQPEKFSFEQSLEEAEKNRPEIKIARLGQESAQIALRSTYDPYRPTLSLNANYGYNVAGLSPRDAWEQRPPNFTHSYSVAFRIPLLIFDGGIIRESKYRALVDIDQAKANIKDAQENVSFEVKNTLTALDNSRERVEIGKASIKLAQESLKIAEMRYGTGATGYLEVTDARNNLRTAELNFLDALIQYSNAKINVYRTLGRSLINESSLQSALSSFPEKDDKEEIKAR